jgi:hypothetical protein
MDTNPTAPVTPEANPTPTVAPPQNPVVVNATPPKKKMGISKKWILIILVLLGLAAIAGVGGYLFMNQSKTAEAPIPTIAPQPVACTQDAKQCPDGSYVSRQGPKCEFAPCPTATASTSADTSNWKTYNNSKYGVSIDYPANWTLNSQERETVPGGALIFSIYETTAGSVRADFHKNFVGDFCNGQSLTTEKITINGRSAEKLNCDGNPQAIKYPVSGDDYWLIGVFVTKENADTFEKIFESFTFN